MYNTLYINKKDHDETLFKYNDKIYPKDFKLMTENEIIEISNCINVDINNINLITIITNNIIFLEDRIITNVKCLLGIENFFYFNLGYKKIILAGEKHVPPNYNPKISSIGHNFHEWLLESFRLLKDHSIGFYLETNSNRNHSVHKEELFRDEYVFKGITLLMIRHNLEKYKELNNVTVLQIDNRTRADTDKIVRNLNTINLRILGNETLINFNKHIIGYEFHYEDYLKTINCLNINKEYMDFYIRKSNKTINKYARFLPREIVEKVYDVYIKQNFNSFNVIYSIHMDLLFIFRFLLNEFEYNIFYGGSAHSEKYVNFFREFFEVEPKVSVSNKYMLNYILFDEPINFLDGSI